MSKGLRTLPSTSQESCRCGLNVTRDFIAHSLFVTPFIHGHVSQSLSINNGLVIGYFNPNAPLRKKFGWRQVCVHV